VVIFHVASSTSTSHRIRLRRLLLLAFIARSLDRPLRIFFAPHPLTACCCSKVGAFASRFRRASRSATLLCRTAVLHRLLAWIERRMPRPPRAAAAAAVLAAALPGAIPYHRLIDTSAESDNLALLPLWWLQETIGRTGHDPGRGRRGAARSGSSSLHLAALRARPACARPALFAFATSGSNGSITAFPRRRWERSIKHHAPSATGSTPAVGRDADVAFVFSGKDPTHHPDTLWGNEFYQPSIGPVYDLRQPSMEALLRRKVHAEG